MKTCPAKYRKKPVVIEAYQTDCEVLIETLEGTMTASPGDFIITGVKGEQYPCKPDIFEATYEPADGEVREMVPLEAMVERAIGNPESCDGVACPTGAPCGSPACRSALRDHLREEAES